MKTYRYMSALQLPRLKWQINDAYELSAEVLEEIGQGMTEGQLRNLLGSQGWRYHSKELTPMKDYLFHFEKEEEF